MNRLISAGISLLLFTASLASMPGCAIQLEPDGKSMMPSGEILPRSSKAKAQEHFVRGNALAREGEFRKAIKRYTKAIEADPGFRDAYVNRGIAHMKTPRFDSALPDFAEALEIGPEDADLYFNLGNAYAIQAQWAMAVKCYQRALELDPHHEGSLNNLGNALGSLDRFDEAMGVFQKYSERFPDKAIGHNNFGVALEMAKRLAEAERSYQAAIQAEPDSPEAYLNLGRMHRTRGDACGAIRYLLEYTKRAKDPDDMSRVQAEGTIGSLLADCPSAASLLDDSSWGN